MLLASMTYVRKLRSPSHDGWSYLWTQVTNGKPVASFDAQAHARLLSTTMMGAHDSKL